MPEWGLHSRSLSRDIAKLAARSWKTQFTVDCTGRIHEGEMENLLLLRQSDATMVFRELQRWCSSELGTKECSMIRGAVDFCPASYPYEYVRVLYDAMHLP